MEDKPKEDRKRHVSADTEDETRYGKRNETANELATFDFTKKSWSSDLVLIVEGTKLFVSKNILSLSSPVFFAMFQSDFKEGSSDEMELPGKKKQDVVEFLGCLYPNIMSEVSGEAATRILPLAEEYQVLQLKQKCEKVLLDSVKSDVQTEKVCQILDQACLYNLESLRERCGQLLSSKPLKQLQEASKKLQLPPKTSNDMVINILNDCIEEHTGKLLALCNEMSEANEALEDFISAEIKNKEDLKLQQSQNWKERTVVLTVLVDEETKLNKNIKLWGKSLSVGIEIKKNKGDGIHVFGCQFSDQPSIHTNIILNEEKLVICDIGMRCFLVSRQKDINNKSFSLKAKIKEKNQKVECALVGLPDVRPVDRGFTRDGKLSLIVQVIMSEPLQQ